MSILLGANMQWVLFSTMMLGMASGVIGCLAYWKKQSLMSDALSHAALPGVVIAFMIIGEKKSAIVNIRSSSQRVAWCSLHRVDPLLKPNY